MSLDNFANIGDLNDKFDEIGRLTHEMPDIKVPRIVVIGDQSSGKSSLLESISGVDLPRGAGTCTRVPLIAQLRTQKSGAQQAAVIIEARDKEGNLMKEEIEEKQISDKIREYTQKLAGDEFIEDAPITLTIYRENFVNLTLIDLPGIVHHDQNQQKMEDITAMVETYIKDSETIILNVLNAQSEAANSKSLHMSAKYDPNHTRTLLVLTKIDQTTDGEGLLAKFQSFYDEENFNDGNVFLVRNRTKRENDNKIPLKEVHENEQRFFEQRNDLKRVPDGCKGSQALTFKLADMQTKRMLNILPQLKNSIEQKFKALTKQRKDFPSVCTTEAEYRVQLLLIVSGLLRKLNNSKDGILVDYGRNANEKLLCSEIAAISEEFADNVRGLKSEKSFLAGGEFLDRLKKYADASYGGKWLPGTIHPTIAVSILAELLEDIRPTFEKFIVDMHQCMLGRIEREIKSLCSDYHQLSKYLLRMFVNILQEQKSITDNYLEDVLESEKNPRTYTQYYMQTVNKLKVQYDNNSNSKENLLVKEAIKVAAYWKTMCEAFVDRSAKMVQLYLVVRTCANEKRIYDFISKENVEDLMALDRNLQRKIEINERELKNIEQARNIANFF